jgi:phosphocarrier protein
MNDAAGSEATGAVVIAHATGLHARPAVKLTKLAKTFAAKVELARSAEGPWIDAKSVVKVMAAKVPQNATLHFRASGVDAVVAVQALIGLVERDFDNAAGHGEPA